LVATLVITASSHSKCCPADQTRPDQMNKMIKIIKMIKKETKIKKETHTIYVNRAPEILKKKKMVDKA
jgi:hypothetical protein